MQFDTVSYINVCSKAHRKAA